MRQRIKGSTSGGDNNSKTEHNSPRDEVLQKLGKEDNLNDGNGQTEHFYDACFAITIFFVSFLVLLLEKRSISISTRYDVELRHRLANEIDLLSAAPQNPPRQLRLYFFFRPCLDGLP